MTMVERVKAAIERTANVVIDYGSPLLDNPEEVARAAIEAMREPTEAMIDASPEDGVHWNKESRGYAASFYAAMIDAALAERPVDPAARIPSSA